MAEELKCFFFSEFDPVAGPKISCQVPGSFPMQESFEAVHDLIITKPNLYNRLISVDISGYRIVGSPRCIDDKKYARNAFIFNFVFVFTSSTCTTAYEPIITKVGDTFRTCELESSFLSDNTHRGKLEAIMTQVFEKLNSHGLCTVNVDDTNCLYLKTITLTPTTSSCPRPSCAYIHLLQGGH
ncbi:GATOR complex protein NPRL2 [Geodia barretti]|uniref:GATOR complex protein NPRL2 n=1 Tax=Geodia barretti TaxID=519541 RepID=A0AA35VW85_GEOBA|nr:GATOR complex protein NPRL2 [Geodia barretti]